MTAAAIDDARDAWANPIAMWVGHLRAGGMSTAAIELRRYQLGRVARAMVDRDPWTVTQDDITAWLASHNWKRESLRSYRSAVRSFYGWAHETGLIEADPASRLRKVPPAQARPRPAPEPVIELALQNTDDRGRLAILEEYRLRQAEELLREAGFVEQPDGSWVSEEEAKPRTTGFEVGFQLRQTGNTGDATAITNGFATAMQSAAGPLGALSDLYGQTGLTAQTLSEAQADAAQRTTAMGDAAGDAYAEVYAAAVISGKSADEIKRMGDAAGLSAEQIGEIQDAASKTNPEAAALAEAMQEGSSAASALDDAISQMQVALEMLAGNTISAEQATRAHNAAIREVAAAGRERADADAKQAEAQAKVNELTDQGITSGADYEAAQRALAEATSDAAGAADDAADKLDGLAESAVGQMERSFEAAGGMNNYQAAVEAATAKMVEQRAQFIASARDAGYSQEAAENLANAQGLIPENVATSYEARRYQESIKAAQDTKGAVDSIPNTKTITFDVNDRASAGIDNLATRVANLPSGKTITIYTNQVNYGGAAGSGQGYAPGIYTGGQVGRAMAISAALNRALAIPGFSTGGQVPGTPPADPTVDNVLASAMGLPIKLRSREWIMPEEAVDLYGPDFMKAIQHRQFPRPRGYSDGGSVSPTSTSSTTGPVEVILTLRGDGPLTEAMVETAQAETDAKFHQFRVALKRRKSQSWF